ncbi:MAG: hypothetical protein KAG45_10645, partial [Methyloprofundus sp.]|nr:hypothetical protein [Methyloprofundus sp.]
YPQILSRFPNDIRLKIVTNMIDRAKSWGIDWESSLVIFAELMISIAPNFDQQENVREALSSDKEHVNQIIKSITEYVPDSAWMKAEVTIEDLPLYLSENFLNASLLEQTTSAIPLVLWDKVADLDIQQYAKDACQLANEIKLHELNDAPISIVVWRCLYGEGFNDSVVNPWVAEITDVDRQPRERIAMLKFRIALDYGRMV